MKISFGADHGGVALKSILINLAKQLGHEVIDRGTMSGDTVDYPDYAKLVATDISNHVANLGVLICKTGIGMSISANKYKGIRAAHCYSVDIARLSRTHNDANVLCLGANFTGPELAKQIFQVWVSTEFEGGRHQNRIDKILESERC